MIAAPHAPIPILLYHGVAPEGPEALAPWVMDPDRFAAHMTALARRGVVALRVSELVDLLAAGQQPPESTVVVTFDDGLADFGEHAWPVLRDLDLPATLYVVTGYVGAEAEWLRPFGAPVPRMLTWDEVIGLDRGGCEIGSHSQRHPELDTLGCDVLCDEVRTSRTVLSMQLGHPVRSFAYPHGYHGKAVVRAVRDAGYDSACAVRNMLSSAGDDPFTLARVTVTADVDVDGLERILDGDGLAVAPAPEQVRTRAWRAYRRARTTVGGRR